MNVIRREPVLVIGTLLNAIVVLVTAFWPGHHLSPGDVAAASTIATAVTSIVVAMMVKPANLATIHAALITIMVAVAGFGLHLSQHSIALVATVIVTVLGYLLREKVSPFGA